MKITFILVGKSNFKFVEEGLNLYSERIKRYAKFDIVYVKDIKKTKGLTELQLKKEEGIEILTKIFPGDWVVLLDEKGKEFSSVSFSGYLENKMQVSIKRLVFIIGGAYGFSEEVYKIANESISLSKMTFSHQIIRIIFLEQLYRAFTILKGEPYHHS